MDKNNDVSMNAAHIRNAAIGVIKHLISATMLENKIPMQQAKEQVADILAQELRREDVVLISGAHLSRVEKMVVEMDIDDAVRNQYLDVLQIIRESI